MLCIQWLLSKKSYRCHIYCIPVSKLPDYTSAVAYPCRKILNLHLHLHFYYRLSYTPTDASFLLSYISEIRFSLLLLQQFLFLHECMHLLLLTLQNLLPEQILQFKPSFFNICICQQILLFSLFFSKSLRTAIISVPSISPFSSNPKEWYKLCATLFSIA